MFATIRFYLDDTNDSIERAFYLETASMVCAAQMARSLCDGYVLATGFSAMVLEMKGTIQSGVPVVKDIADLATFGIEFRRKLAGESHDRQFHNAAQGMARIQSDNAISSRNDGGDDEKA